FSGLALFTAVLQTFFGFLASFINGRSPLLYIFGKIAGAASIATWVWIGILFRFNNRPLSTHPLTRSLAHFTSFVVLGLAWLGIGIMLVTQVVFECRSKDLWCAASSFSATLAFLTGTFCKFNVPLFFIYLSPFTDFNFVLFVLS
ncbi:hypothetical protein AN958_00254, partial [Leucoagaricus sp. SymC.cos]